MYSGEGILILYFTIINKENTMIKDMGKNGDCSVVDRSIRLRDLKRRKINDKEPMPFYLHAGDCSGVVFNGKPEIVRKLMRINNKQKLFFHIELLSFLNSEGIVARRGSAPVDDVPGYHANLSNNKCDESNIVTRSEWYNPTRSGGHHTFS